MIKFRKRKGIFCILNIIIIMSFLWPNVVLANGLSTDCLAPISNLPEIMNDLIPLDVIQTLESAELPAFKVIYDREVEAKITDNAEEIRCFGIRDGAKWVFYIVDFKSREITRFVISKDVEDKFFSVLNRIEPLQCLESNTFENYRKDVYRLTDKLLPYVAKSIERLPTRAENKRLAFENVKIFDMKPVPGQKIVTYEGESANPYITVKVCLGSLRPEDVDVEIHYGKCEGANIVKRKDVKDVRMGNWEIFDEREGIYLYKGKIPLSDIPLGVHRFTTRVSLNEKQGDAKIYKWHNQPKSDGVLIVTKYSSFEKKILSQYPESISWVKRHAVRVARLSQIIARQVIDTYRAGDEIDSLKPEDIRFAALAHDLGKGISPEMIEAINSSSGYTPIISTHTITGVSVLRTCGIHNSVMEDVALHHHDPWNIKDKTARFIGEIVYIADQIDASQATDRAYKDKRVADIDKLRSEMKEHKDKGRISAEIYNVIDALLGERDRPFMDVIYEARGDISWRGESMGEGRKNIPNVLASDIDEVEPHEDTVSGRRQMQSSPIIKSAVNNLMYFSDNLEVNGKVLQGVKDELRKAKDAVALYKVNPLNEQHKLQLLNINGREDYYRVIRYKNTGKYFVVREALLIGLGFSEEAFLARLASALAREKEIGYEFSFENLPDVVLVEEMTASPNLGANCTKDGWFGINKVLYTVEDQIVKGAEFERIIMHELWHETAPQLTETYLEQHDELFLKKLLQELKPRIEESTYKLILEKFLDKEAKSLKWISEYIEIKKSKNKKLDNVKIHTSLSPESIVHIAVGESIKVKLNLEGINVAELEDMRVMVRTNAYSFDDTGRYVDSEIKEEEEPFLFRDMSKRDKELVRTGEDLWELEIPFNYFGNFYVTFYVVDSVTNKRKWIGGDAYVSVYPEWVKTASIAVTSLRHMREKDPENRDHLGTFSDLEWDIREKAKQGFNGLLLLPVSAPIHSSPYEQLSPYALNPEHIDWNRVTDGPRVRPTNEDESRIIFEQLGQYHEFKAWVTTQERKGVMGDFREYAVLKAVNDIGMKVNLEFYAQVLTINKLLKKGLIELKEDEQALIKRLMSGIGSKDMTNIDFWTANCSRDDIQKVNQIAMDYWLNKGDKEKGFVLSYYMPILNKLKLSIMKAFNEDYWFRGLIEFALYEQFIAQKQLKEALETVESLGMHLLFDQPFFACTEGAVAVFHPEMMEWMNEDRIRYAGYPGADPDNYSQHWCNLARWNYGSDLNIVVKPIDYWINFGFGGFRWDAVHYGNHDLWKLMRNGYMQGKAVFPIGEQLGGPGEVERQLLQMGYILYAGTEFNSYTLRNLEDTFIWSGGISWFVTSDTHDSPRLYELFKRYFKGGLGENPDPILVNKAMLTEYAFCSSVFSMMSGSEYGVTDRINTPGVAVDWKGKSPHADATREKDLREYVRRLNQLRHTHPAMKIYGNLIRLKNSVGNESNEMGGVSSMARAHEQGSLVLVNNLSGFRQRNARVYIPFSKFGINLGSPFRVKNIFTGEIREYIPEKDFPNGIDYMTFDLAPGESIIWEFLPQKTISVEDWEGQLSELLENIDSLAPVQLQKLIYGSVKSWAGETFTVTSYGNPIYKAPYAGLMGLKFIFRDVWDIGALDYHIEQGDFCHFLTSKVLFDKEFRELKFWFSDFPRIKAPVDKKREAFRRVIDGIIAHVEQHLAEEVSSGLSADQTTRQLNMTSLSFMREKPDCTLRADHKKRGVVQDGTYIGIDAGHPHFIDGMGDWGRDTFISLPGLLLETGRYNEAKTVILNYARHVRRGMIPNLLDFGINPRYNTIDASLWFFYAIREYIKKVPDGVSILNERITKKYYRPEEGDKKEYTIWEIMEEMIQAHIKGIHFRDDANDSNVTEKGRDIKIYMDKSDKLLSGGNSEAQLTWMDERVRGHASTPRSGKAVEINALWYNALKTMAELASGTGRDDSNSEYKYADLANEVKESFNQKFWFDQGGYFYDVIECEEDSDGRISRQLRPNQLFALSIRPEFVPVGRKRLALKIIQEKLLTRHGLRTLAPDDPQYRGMHEREKGSYHNGTVWPWLIGAFMDAYHDAYKNDEKHNVKKEMRKMLEGLIRHVQGNYGTIAEIFDGDIPNNANWAGAFSQAWSVAELLRISLTYLDGRLELEEYIDTTKYTEELFDRIINWKQYYDQLTLRWGEEIDPEKLEAVIRYICNLDYIDEGMRDVYIMKLLLAVICSSLNINGYEAMKPLSDMIVLDRVDSQAIKDHARQFRVAYDPDGSRSKEIINLVKKIQEAIPDDLQKYILDFKKRCEFLLLKKQRVVRKKTVRTKDEIRGDYRKRSLLLGGKGVGLGDLVSIKDKIQKITGVEIEIPNYQILSVPEGWNSILKYNADLIREGNFINSHRQEVIDAIKTGRISEYANLTRLQGYLRINNVPGDTDRYLDGFMLFLSDSIKYPDELNGLVNEKLARLGDATIERSSGAMEDQFEQSMADVFPSFTADDKSEAKGNVQIVFKLVIRKIWSEEKGQLNESGFAVVLQDFIEADKGGVALSNGNDRVSIEAVVGRPTTAVKQTKPNATIYDCRVGKKVSFNIIQCFTKYPYEIETADGRFNRTNSRKKIDGLWEKGTTEIMGTKSPLTEDEVKKVALVVKAIEDVLGYSVDIEFAIKDGKIYLLQKRPCVGQQQRAAKQLSKKINPETVTIAAGKPYRSGTPLPVVIFNERDKISPEAIAWLVSKYGENGYIKVQDDVISEEYHLQPDKIRGQKILVDPNSGTRAAHNMQLFRDRFGNDFVYLAGPKLKLWLRGLTYYEPVPNGGILISRELVMVESNGGLDYGGMYVAENGDVGDTSEKEPWYLEEMRSLLRDSRHFSEAEMESALVFFKEIADKLRFKDLFSEKELQLLNDIIISYAKIQESGDDVTEKHAIEYLVEYYLANGVDGIAAIKEKFKLISYIIDFRAIWPSTIDNRIIDILDRLKTIHDACEWFSEKFGLVLRDLNVLLDRREIEIMGKEDAEREILAEAIERVRALIRSIEIKYPHGEPRSILLREEFIALSSPQQAARYSRAVINKDKTEDRIARQKAWPVKIVFIDDDTARCRTYKQRMMREYEGRFDVEISIFRDKDEALAYVEKERPHVIFVDYALAGGVSGVDLIEEVRNIQGYDPVVYMEPGGMEKDAGRIGSLGITWCYINHVVMTVEGFLLSYRDKLSGQEELQRTSISGATPVFRVVILDDDGENRGDVTEIFREICVGENCPVEVFSRPTDKGAIEWILNNRPQIIFTDLLLGEFSSGDKFIKKLLYLLDGIKDYRPKIYLATGAVNSGRINDLKGFVTILDMSDKQSVWKELRKAAEGVIAGIQSDKETRTGTAPELASVFKAVLVDDDRVTLKAWKPQIERWGRGKGLVTEVLAKENIDGVLEWILRNRPQLILVDLSIGKIKGEEFIKDILLKIRQCSGYRPEIVVISAANDFSAYGYLQDLGVRFISKMEYKNLRGFVRSVIDSIAEIQNKPKKPTFGVAIIDDGDDYSGALNLLFEEVCNIKNCRYDVFIQENTDGAEEWILANRPQLIIVDYYLNGIERGDEFIIKLISRLSNVSGYKPVIILNTASSDTTKLSGLKELGVRIVDGNKKVEAGYYMRIVEDIIDGMTREKPVIGGKGEAKYPLEKKDVLKLDVGEVQKVTDDSRFFEAVEYFNNMTGPLTWEKVIDLYEFIKGDRNDRSYTAKVREQRLSSVNKLLPNQEDIQEARRLVGLMRVSSYRDMGAADEFRALLEKIRKEGKSFSDSYWYEKSEDIIYLANKRFDKEEDVIKNAVKIYAYIINKHIFIDDITHTAFPGFGELGGGHHRIAWFLMNYFLINNGYTPFYFLDKKEINRGSVDERKIERLIADRVKKNTAKKSFLCTVTFDEYGGNVETGELAVSGKSGLYNEQYLKDAIDALIKEYGAGILSGIKSIETVDRTGPVGSQADGKAVIDIDTFRDKNLVLEVLEHEALHEILELLLPGRDNIGLKEAIATLASVKRFLRLSEDERRTRMELLKDKSNGLDPDGKYARFLEGILTSKFSEDELIKIVISFVEANLDVKVVLDAKRLLDDGLDLLGDFSEAGRLVDAVRETEGRSVRVIRTFSDPRIIGKCSDRVRKLIGFIVRYDKWQIPKETDTEKLKYVVYSAGRANEKLKTVIGEIEKDSKVRFLDDVSKVPSGADFVVLVDPEDLSNWSGKKFNYVPLPYMEQSLKIAAIMALNDGEIEKRSPAYNFVKDFYEILLDRGLAEEEVLRLFTEPWFILPQIKDLSKDLSILREAITSLEKSA